MGTIWLTTGILLAISNTIEMILLVRSNDRAAFTGQITITSITLGLAMGNIIAGIGLLRAANWARMVIWPVAGIYLVYATVFVLVVVVNGLNDLERLHAADALRAPLSSAVGRLRSGSS